MTVIVEKIAVKSTIIETMPNPSYPDSTPDGFPGRLLYFPDSMKAAVTSEDRALRVLVHFEEAAGPVTVVVRDSNGPVRRADLGGSGRSPMSWNWDLRDSNHQRVAPGLYDVHVNNRIGQRVGYIFVR